MNLKWMIIPAVFSVVLLASCVSDTSDKTNSYGSSNNNYGKTMDKAETKSKDDTSQVDALPQKDVLATVQSKLDSNVVVILPTSIPLSSDKHYLSAATTSTDNKYDVVFYETKQPTSVNSPDLKDTSKATPIATVSGQNYETEEEAGEATGHLNNVNTGVNGVDLGSGITGYSDAGAGSTFLNWAEGRYSLGVRNTTSADPEVSIDLAKKVVAKLEKETLPIPHQLGAVKLEAEPNRADGNSIRWQNQKTVYSVSQFADPLDGVSIATSYEK
ncbi:lipoprotein [Listeria weihenstephanensis FSL R9-0317]|uniref:Lipoprotein n=1 Tax=Listeria weihenstephanensis TaxID=1006155 RepID=A0A1S7FWE4_9LIST|nr:hypothetical protein [Listeria weihenstephanensis]AQY51655.1 hypothetical protein UE46_11855 [Listeria weihenstephanensis]EUJ34812.1 lipoprotein [Listeria weihenstephanensis FSL R9-0317]